MFAVRRAAKSSSFRFLKFSHICICRIAKCQNIPPLSPSPPPPPLPSSSSSSFQYCVYVSLVSAHHICFFQHYNRVAAVAAASFRFLIKNAFCRIFVRLSTAIDILLFAFLSLSLSLISHFSCSFACWLNFDLCYHYCSGPLLFFVLFVFFFLLLSTHQYTIHTYTRTHTRFLVRIFCK